MGMRYGHFTIINVSSAFVWAAAHILPGMLLTAWLKSIGLSLELVIVIGTLILIALFMAVHYHRRVLLFLAPWLGRLGRSIQARWAARDTID
jgi:membrane protein DedA with SNARE-associated domain